MVLGLGTVIYQVKDLARAKEWYSNVFGVKPYFDEPFYVGFNIGGYELGLNPDSTVTGPGPGGSVGYWRVGNIDQVVERFVTMGATVVSPVQDVGGGVKVATLGDPEGNLIGLIENPNFRLPD